MIQLLRPKHWFKNVFVLFPLLFSGALWTQYAWTAATLSALVTACFCSWSSAVYVLNDVCDVESDRQHPRKCHRPIASGKVSILTAIVICLLLALLPFAVLTGLYFKDEAFQKPVLYFTAVGLAYLVNNVVYDLLFRKLILLDVVSIAFGFVLRILGGCAILLVVPSHWILISGFTMALFLGFGKRRMECSTAGIDAQYRSSLQQYSVKMLNALLGITAACSLLTYTLYTISPDTVKLHNTAWLICTVPFVFFGIYRYFKDSISGRYDGAVEAIISDKQLIVCVLLWLATVIGIFIYVK